MKLERFTLVGATTRTGLLTSPLRDRFQIQERLDYYAAGRPHGDRRPRRRASSRSRSSPPAARRLARRARGTPRIANRLLRRAARLRRGRGRRPHRPARIAERTLDAAGDRRLRARRRWTGASSRSSWTKFGGGPVGVETIAASVGEERDTIEDVYEPFLMREGFLQRTPRGRVALPPAYAHLGRDRPRGGQDPLF